MISHVLVPDRACLVPSLPDSLQLSCTPWTMDTPSRYPPNRLKRNTACQRCNQRKTKCDAVRPTCGACVRHNRHRERSKSGLGPAIACIYDDAEGSHEGGQTVPGESVASGPSSGLVADRPTELPPRGEASSSMHVADMLQLY